MSTLASFLLRASGVFLLASIVGCAARSDAGEEESETSTAALEEAWSLSNPTVYEVERPLDLSFTMPDDWSSLEVADPLDPSGRWRPANAITAPRVIDRPSGGSGIKDKLDHGFGSGPCRLKLNPFKKEIGFRCKWTF